MVMDRRDVLHRDTDSVGGVLSQGDQVLDQTPGSVGRGVEDPTGTTPQTPSEVIPPPAATDEQNAVEEAQQRARGEGETSVGEGGDSGAQASIAQGDSNTSSTEQDAATDAARGAPHPDRNELRRSWRYQGEQRIHAFKSMFGEDALALGHLLFKVPPLAIRINKGNITYRWKPLRTNESIAVKSGNGECYIEIDLAFVGVDHINESLAHLVTLWKKFPFCFVENGFIRSQMIPDSPEDSMMLCLESLVLDAVAGSPNVVWATLITSWFNYKPFSINAWYRRNWQGINDPETDPNRGVQASVESQSVGAPPGALESASSEQEGVILEQIPRNDADTTIIDLSALQEPESLTIALPPEARLQIPDQEADPSDPYIRPTYPVVYPWNSVPFMQRVLQRPDNPNFIEGWNDGLTMNWKSFTRRPMPRSLAYQHREESVPITRGAGSSRSQDAAPQPVSGDRNIILFIGDSITVGYLGLNSQHGDTRAGQATNAAGQFIPIPLHSFRPPQVFTSNQTGQGFEFYSIARVGASMTGGGGMARRFRQLIGSNQFKTPGGQDGDRLAAVVAMGGINDRPGTIRAGRSPENQLSADTVLAGYSEIKTLAIGAGAIFCPMTPWPIYGIRDDYISVNNERELVTVCEQVMERWGTEDARWKAVNIHTSGITQDPTTFTGLPTEAMSLRRHPSGSSTYDPHPTGNGNTVLATHVARSLPWNQIRANVGAATTWTVCYVEDGDTIWVFSGGEVRQVRFKFMNTFETYPNYNDPADTALYGQTDDPNFGTGQDSGRPQDQQFGKLAKNELIRILGAAADGSGNGATCEIEFDDDRDAFQRYLGVIYKGGRNINLHLVRQGLATVPEQYRTTEGTEYVQALAAAESENLGYHNWQSVSALEGTRVLMEPDDWLREHPPAVGPGSEFGFSSTNLPPGCQGSAS